MATALTQTTLSGAITPSQNVFNVAAATGITAPVANVNQQIYVIGPGQARGELMTVVAVTGTSVTVSRLDEFKAFYPTGSLVLIGPAPVSGSGFGGMIMGGGFQAYDPPGASASNNTSAASGVIYTPWVNVTTGKQWIWSTVVNCWVPGWNNEALKAPTAAVASFAGVIVPSGPLFHVTGAEAVTGFTNASMIGFTLGRFTIIPDGTFTWTNATNIALGGTAVVSKALEFVWDANAVKWFPSYIA
jgi:hypothetical protein